MGLEFRGIGSWGYIVQKQYSWGILYYAHTGSLEEKIILYSENTRNLTLNPKPLNPKPLNP